MRYVLIAIILFFFVVQIGQAQEPSYHYVYLPIITNEYCEVPMPDNKWRLIKPVPGSNYVYNPSAEIVGNFSALVGAAVSRETTYQKYGLYSYFVDVAAANDGIRLTLSALTDTEHFVSLRIRKPFPDLYATIGTTTKSLRFIEKIDGNWDLYGIGFAAAEANGATALDITVASAIDFYTDGIQVEPLNYMTTYIDGTQAGCESLGVIHASISQRSGESRAGGRPVDLYDEYGFLIQKIVGAGSAPKTLGIDSYALLPGGELNNVKVNPRDWTIIGKFYAETEEKLHENIQALDTELQNSSYVGSQPILIRFNGARVQKEIAVHYRGGLEGDLPAYYDDCYEQDRDQWIKVLNWTTDASVQMFSPNPYWQEVGESAALLDTEDSSTFRIAAARLRSTGQWDDLGPPDALGTYTRIFAIAEDETYIYLGGNFLNFNNIAAADYIVRYEKATGTFSAMGAGLNDLVQAIEIASNGDVIIGGNFTNAGGVAAADYLTRWDGAAYNAVGAPDVGAAVITAVQSLAFDKDGNLYIGGLFINWADIANADYIVMWDGAAYSALGTGANNNVVALAVRRTDNRLFLGGLFTDFDGTGAERMAQWDGTNGAVVGTATGMDNNCNALAATLDGLIIAGGAFDTAGGVTVNRIGIWDGQTFYSLAGGMNNDVDSISIAPDNTIWVTGDFTQAGLLTTTAHLARWNGYAWVHYDFTYPFTGEGVVMASQYTDPVVKGNYDIWLGFDNSATGDYGGLVTVDNEGSTIAFPKIIFNRSGGTSATIETLRNERTSDELFFDYDLLDGETLTIDLSPTQKSIVSSQFGSRLDAILANSDFGDWSLLTGNNDITSFVLEGGAPTIVGYMLWRDSYDGYD